MTAPDETPRATLQEDERAVDQIAEILNDLIVTHSMWIADDGTDLDYLPEREARIANFIREAAEQLAPVVEAARAEEREQIRLLRCPDCGHDWTRHVEPPPPFTLTCMGQHGVTYGGSCGCKTTLDAARIARGDRRGSAAQPELNVPPIEEPTSE